MNHGAPVRAVERQAEEGSPNVRIRVGDLEVEREHLIALMVRNLPRVTDDRTFNWLYRENPHGEAHVWLATRPKDQIIIGAAAAFPRRMYISGQEAIAWVLGDFFIDDRYRTLGPAVALQRACLEHVNDGTVPFCYDFPSSRMMAIYARLRIEPFGRMVRLAKALRVDRKVKQCVQVPVLRPLLNTGGNLFLRLRDGLCRQKHDFKISVHSGDYADEFSELTEVVGASYGSCVQRSAEYLNWRYHRHPFERYEMITARLNGELLAYAVFRTDGEDAMLVDLFGIINTTVMQGIIDALTSILRARGIVTLSASLLESHSWVPLFLHLGFQPREALPVVIYGPSGKKPVADLNWFLMHGDRDS